MSITCCKLSLKPTFYHFLLAIISLLYLTIQLFSCNNTVVFMQMLMVDFYVTFGYKYIFASHHYCTIYIITQKGFYYTKIILTMLHSVSLLFLFIFGNSYTRELDFTWKLYISNWKIQMQNFSIRTAHDILLCFN